MLQNLTLQQLLVLLFVLHVLGKVLEQQSSPQQLEQVDHLLSQRTLLQNIAHVHV